MLIFLILSVFMLVFVISVVLKIRKKNNAPYYITKTRLEKDIAYYNILGDWRKIQELKLQNLWIESIKEIYTYNYLKKDKENNDDNILSKLTVEDLKYPLTWSIDDFAHVNFVRKIIEVTRDFTIESTDRRPFKPDRILPIPKANILKAFSFFTELLECNEPMVKFDDKERSSLLDFIYVTRTNLIEFYLDTGNDDLPQDGRENICEARRYNKTAN